MRICRERHIYSMGVSEPVATVAAPCSLTVETCDCFNGQVTEDGQSKSPAQLSHVNPATGPIVVEGAEPVTCSACISGPSVPVKPGRS